MKRALMVTATLAALVMPLTAAASASPSKADKRAAKQECRAERQADKAAFKAKYHGLGGCVHQKARENAREHRHAQKDCRAESTADPAAFQEKYGKSHNKKSAFGKCVSQAVRDQGEDDGSWSRRGIAGAPGRTPGAPLVPTRFDTLSAARIVSPL